MAQSVADILGVSLEMAQNLLDVAGGDEALAIDLGLGGGGFDGGTTTVDTVAMPPASHDNTSLSLRIWPSNKVPDSWKEQRLDSRIEDDKLVQGQNGPCGVLAVVQAELWTLDDDDDDKNSNAPFADKLCTALASILQRVVDKSSNSDKVTMADGSQVDVASAAKSITTAWELVEAVARTAQSGNNSNNTLVEGPHALCSVDLMCLLLRGYIGKGHVLAWDEQTKAKLAFYGDQQSKIGLLSYSEIEESLKVADDLKFDKNVWILHTGDHFVTMRTLPNSDHPSTTIKLEVYDGLPPAGPKSTMYELSGDTSLAQPATNFHVESFTKKRPGQPDDIVQAKKTESTNYMDWTFEVVPAVPDDTVKGPIDDDPNEPVYNFDQPFHTNSPWRCASCYYTRYQTMNFGINSLGGETCDACGKTRSTAMWSLWQTYDELSPKMKQRARRMYAPKLELVLSTLWPKAQCTEMKES